MRKRVLLIFPRVPFPLIGGDNLTNSNIVKILNEHFDLDVIIISFEGCTSEAEEFLKNNCKSYKIFTFPRMKFYLNAFRSFLNFKPLQVNSFYFPQVQKYINSIAHKYDLLFPGSIRVADYLLPFKKPKIINLADSIGLNYKYSFQRTHSLFWKAFYFIEFPTMLRFERKIIKKYNWSLMFNRREIEYFNINRIIQIPQAVKQQLLTYEKLDNRFNNFVSYFGKMNYRPNIDAVLWFVEKVFPYLPEGINFQIIGANPVEEILKLQNISPRIIVKGFVEDPYYLLKSSLCVVAPMQTGGGIQNKILESMALGTIVVTTSYSAYPIARKEDKVLLIADEPKEWVEIIKDIYHFPEKYSQMKIDARNHIRQNFSFEKFEKKLLEVINSALPNSEV